MPRRFFLFQHQALKRRIGTDGIETLMRKMFLQIIQIEVFSLRVLRIIRKAVEHRTGELRGRIGVLQPIGFHSILFRLAQGMNGAIGVSLIGCLISAG